MEKNKLPKPGEIYQHFKGKLYQIITVAVHTETKEKMVIYQALYGNYATYARPLEMFISEVDHLKYPLVKQKYRFEIVMLQDETEDMIEQNLQSEASKDEMVNRNDEKITTIADIGLISDHNISTVEGVNHGIANWSEPVPTIVDQSNEGDGTVNVVLLEFLDATSYTKKLEVLLSNKKHLNDRLINDMAVSLDCAVNEGPIDQRIQELVHCLQAMRRFEDRRLR